MTTTSRRTVLEGDVTPRFAEAVTLRFNKLREKWLLLTSERTLEPDEHATVILQLVDGVHSIYRIADELSRRYEAPRKQVYEDVITLLQELADRGIIEA